ncbi:MAG: efflux RND transporter periplasmic adaptor subunit [Candidatus Azobacteroides sp.]|nr:efflux RND transporter periplasmic adaptor subunit [Candidatus Azobacteroides sp.]
MKKTIIIAIIAVTIGSIVWILAGNKKEIDSRKETKTTADVIAVTAASAETRKADNQLNLVGTAEANREVTVASEIAGKITQINFKLGDYVNQGTVLARVDDAYKRMTLENAQIAYDKNKEDYERYKVLREGDAATETQLRDMKVAYENSVIQLDNAKKQLNDTRIVAPFSGYIISKNTELGAYVNAGTAIAGIADISQLKVVVSVSESNVYTLRSGQEVNVSTPVYPNNKFTGKITNISPKGDDSHSYPVEIAVPNSKDHPLKAGTYVNINIDRGQSAPSLMIPRDAIVSSVKDPSVYLVNGENVKLTKITTGRDFQSYIEVTGGLKEGDKVVTNGQINLMDGAKVSIIKN